MSASQAIELYGDLLIAAAAVISTGSAILHARVDWRATSMGVHLMAYLASLAVLFDITFVNAFLIKNHQPLWWELTQAFLYTAVPVTMAWRLWIQWKVRPRGGRRRLPSNSEAAMTGDKGSDDGGKPERAGAADS